MIHSTLEQAYIKKDKVSIISLKDHNYFSKTQNSRFKNIKKEYKKLSRAGSMPNLNTIVKPHESIKEEIMKEEKQKDSSSKFSRRSTVAQPPIRQIENLKINIESFPEESLNITNKSQIQEETVSNNESSKTKQNTDSDMLTMRYDSLMNKTHKKVGKVQFQSNHVIHSERLILPPVHSVENCTESLKKMPKLVRKLLGKKLKINKIIDQIEQENEKKEIREINNMTRVQSYFENEHRRENLSIDFKSIERFDQETIKEYRNLQKLKALQLMKKLNTKFNA